MPTTYAHYRFGQDVLGRLDGETKELIHNNIDIFNYGIYGPDILFFHSIGSDKITKKGSTNHHEPFKIILSYATSQTASAKDKAVYLAYIFGFICHFALDSYCHGYVNYTKNINGMTHGGMENEFDRFLMELDGHNPRKFKPVMHMKPTRELANQIAYVYPEIDSKTAYKCIKAMRRSCSFCVPTNPFKELIITISLFFSGNMRKKSGIVISRRKDLRSEETNSELFELYQRAVEVAAKLISKFDLKHTDFPSIYDFTFSTKVRVESELDKAMEAI